MTEHPLDLQQKAALLAGALAGEEALDGLPGLTAAEAAALLGRASDKAQGGLDGLAPYETAPGLYAMYPLFYLAGRLRAVKKTEQPVTAFCLGNGSALERQLIRRGLIKKEPDGSFRVFSREAAGGMGELAQPGDYIKLDSAGSPYPSRRTWFEENHRQGPEGTFYQRPVPRLFWKAGLPVREEMRFLLATGRLHLHPEDTAHYFQARLWDAPLAAARDAALVFYGLSRNSGGALEDVQFNFVSGDEFAGTYTVVVTDREGDLFL